MQLEGLRFRQLEPQVIDSLGVFLLFYGYPTPFLTSGKSCQLFF